MAIAANAGELQETAEAGYELVEVENVRDAFFAGAGASVARGEGPNGVEALTKYEKAVLLKGVVAPEVTSVNPPPYDLDELNHRFSHIKPDATPEPIFPHPQV